MRSHKNKTWATQNNALLAHYRLTRPKLVQRHVILCSVVTGDLPQERRVAAVSTPLINTGSDLKMQLNVNP